MMEEVLQAPFSTSALEGFQTTTSGEKSDLKVTGLTLAGGQPVDPGKRYVIALNAFDAQSGGRRYGLLRELVIRREAKLTLLAQESRDALIEFFTEKKIVRLADLS